MRILLLLVVTATHVCASEPAAQPERERAFREIVLASWRRPFPTDRELGQRLADRRKDFERLVAMVRTDKELVRIAPDFTWTTTSCAWPRPTSEIGISVERWNEYRDLFRLLGLEAGVERPGDHRDAVFLIVQTKGLVPHGAVKGYAYSASDLEPRCESLDILNEGDTGGICFRYLGKNWYVFLDRN